MFVSKRKLNRKKMKKNLKLSVFILAISFVSNGRCFAQSIKTSFDVKISGFGKNAIIFIPGFACSGEVWNETKVTLEKNFTCFTLTMAGFAGTKPEENPTFKKWETEIVAYIIANKIERPIIIGHSMGGSLAMAIASDYPYLVSKIVVVDALPCLMALMNPEFKVKEVAECSEISEQFLKATTEEFYQMQKKSIPRLLADESKQELVVNWSMQTDRKTFAKMYCDFSNTDLREKIATIQCPNLILLESPFVNFKPQIELQFKNMKTANLKYASKGLHFIMFDDKEWYTNELNQFLN